MTIQYVELDGAYVLAWPTDDAGREVVRKVSRSSNSSSSSEWRVIGALTNASHINAILKKANLPLGANDQGQVLIYHLNPNPRGYTRAEVVLRDKGKFLTWRMQVISAILGMSRVLGVKKVDPSRIYVSQTQVCFAYPHCALGDEIEVRQLLNPAATPGWQCSSFTQALYRVPERPPANIVPTVPRPKFRHSNLNGVGVETLTNANYLVRRIRIPEPTDDLDDAFHTVMHAFLREQCVAEYVANARTNLVVRRNIDASLMWACCEHAPAPAISAFAAWVSCFVLVYDIVDLTPPVRGLRLADATHVMDDLFTAKFRVYFPPREKRIAKFIDPNVRVRVNAHDNSVVVVWTNVAALLPREYEEKLFLIPSPPNATDFYSPPPPQPSLVKNKKVTTTTRPISRPPPVGGTPPKPPTANDPAAWGLGENQPTAARLIDEHVLRYTRFQTKHDELSNRFEQIMNSFDKINLKGSAKFSKNQHESAVKQMKDFAKHCKQLAPNDIPDSVMGFLELPTETLVSKKKHLHRLCVAAMRRLNTKQLDPLLKNITKWQTFLTRYLDANKAVFGDLYRTLQTEPDPDPAHQKAIMRLREIVRSVQAGRPNSGNAATGFKKLKGLTGHMPMGLHANERHTLHTFAELLNERRNAANASNNIGNIARTYLNTYFAPKTKNAAVNEDARSQLHRKLHVSKVATIRTLIDMTLANDSAKGLVEARARLLRTLSSEIAHADDAVKARFFRLALAKWTRSQANPTIDGQIANTNNLIDKVMKLQNEGKAVHMTKKPHEEKNLRISAIALRFQRLLMSLDDATKQKLESTNWAFGGHRAEDAN